MFTTSLEVSKKLKDAGVKIEVEWWWVKLSKKILDLPKEQIGQWKLINSNEPPDILEHYPAPTLGELVRELPYGIEGYNLYFCKMETIWATYYRNLDLPDDKTTLFGVTANTPEDAAGLMLLKLKERG